MPAPLPERLRPQRLDDIVGQEHLTGPRGPLRALLARGELPSLLLWGPPGSGKTTLARVLASHLGRPWRAMSAVEVGLRELRAVVEEARAQPGLVLFLDEIHRFHKGQQDALLPHVERGLLTLLGATTENPSFELVPALRSRLRLFRLHPLAPADLRRLLTRALTHPDGLPGTRADDDALELLAQAAGGDARRALAALEVAAALGEGHVTVAAARQALGTVSLGMDAGGDWFYDLVSALHKSVRANHVDAALYYLARLLAGGADPRYLARRLARIALEDVGLADPNALRVALAAREAYDLLGSPEGELALAYAAVYLALAPKSNAVDRAWHQAQRAAEAHPTAPVPLPLRNAPTALLAALGHGRGYVSYHDDPAAAAALPYLPPELADATFYDAAGEGWEARVRERLRELRDRFRRARSTDP